MIPSLNATDRHEELENGEPKSEQMTRTDELVQNHGFKRKNLPSEASQCFDRIYQRFTGKSPAGNAEGRTAELVAQGFTETNLPPESSNAFDELYDAFVEGDQDPVQEPADYSATPGAGASPKPTTTSSNRMPSLSANERMEEL